MCSGRPEKQVVTHPTFTGLLIDVRQEQSRRGDVVPEMLRMTNGGAGVSPAVRPGPGSGRLTPARAFLRRTAG